MRQIVYGFMVLCCVLQGAWATSTQELTQESALSLSIEEITHFSELAGLDVLGSDLAKGSGSKVIAISDFYNLADFEVDSTLLARTFLQALRDSKLFTLTNAIAGNANNTDPILDSIRTMRNRAEFQDIIPKNALLTPQYSLSGRISSEMKESGAKTIVQYTIILTITNLESGLVEWDYIDSIKKVYAGKIPNHLLHQTRYGLMCAGSLQADIPIQQACELAIAEIWEHSFADIPQSKVPLITQYAKRACELDSAFGCRAVGASWRYGVGVKQDFAKALHFYEKACKGNDGNGCYNVALLYQNAQGVKQDFSKAMIFAHHSCMRDFDAGCELEQKLGAITKDDELDERGQNLTKQCEGDDGVACGNLAFYYHHGVGGASRNLAKAAHLFEKGCALLDANSCYQIGLWHIQGLGGTLKDWRIVAEYLDKPCNVYKVESSCKNTSDTKSCHNVFHIYQSNACFSLGSVYEQGDAHLQKDVKKALASYKKACDMGLENACVYYANLKESLK